MSARVFIDGAVGTTGLEIRERLAGRADITQIILDEDRRKDAKARAEAINDADFVILCLPDTASREAASGRQRITKSASLIASARACASLRRSSSRTIWLMSARPASRSRISRPVVPTAPSMKTRAVTMPPVQVRLRRDTRPARSRVPSPRHCRRPVRKPRTRRLGRVRCTFPNRSRALRARLRRAPKPSGPAPRSAARTPDRPGARRRDHDAPH